MEYNDEEYTKYMNDIEDSIKREDFSETKRIFRELKYYILGLDEPMELKYVIIKRAAKKMSDQLKQAQIKMAQEFLNRKSIVDYTEIEKENFDSELTRILSPNFDIKEE